MHIYRMEKGVRMKIVRRDNHLWFSHKGERVQIEAWGRDALRIRATKYNWFRGENKALSEKTDERSAVVSVSEDGLYGEIINGRLKVTVNEKGVLRFYKDEGLFLQEFHRNYDFSASPHSICMKLEGRMYEPIVGGDYRATVRFEANDDEKLFGMGTYQQPYLDLKGCTLELAQRNSQTSIPFVLSSSGYGFLWNHPGVGTATFGRNYTEWKAEQLKEIDYWITAADTPKQILKNYTEVVGRPPHMSDDLLGLWQCKLRYRTQEEVLKVAREYHRRNIPLSVIVIDFFHWTRQGDWHFDPVYWPDPKAMCDELHSYGIKVAVSVWPSVDRKSENFEELYDRGLLIRTEHGAAQTYDYQGDCVSIDVTNPEAQQYLWKKCMDNYASYGIDMFWLDNCEPDYGVYDFRNSRYSIGTALEMTNVYPKMMAKTFYHGQKLAGRKEICSLIRCGWVGSQKYGALLWSGDVNSTFESLKDQVIAGIEMGIAGIPWWNSDVGGFMTQDCFSDFFKELLVRWFEYAVFTPVLRMHGDRGPHDIPPLSDLDYGGGYLYTGHDNALWDYGEEVYQILLANLQTRLEMKPYLKKLYQEASDNGSPLIRAMFYEYPDDETCWEVEDQYMFGEKYLVAPVLQAGAVSRKVYLPHGVWREIHSGNIYEGGQWIEADAPLQYIPVLEKM